MDVGFFLEQRLIFIERHYAMAVTPFVERKRQIEAEEPPFVPPYSEDGEPPFLMEWLEADDSIKVLGSACISMLAASLHVYLQTWEVLLRLPIPDALRGTFKKRGWFGGYRQFFTDTFDAKFEESGANLDLLEEVVLVRNRTQHPEHLTDIQSKFSAHDLKRVPSPFFVSDRERALLSSPDEEERRWLIEPQIEVTDEQLRTAIGEARKFYRWFESQWR
ncbi:MAG: hypothetical protein V4864_14010 [Pseudomonadota bacterium]